MKRQGLLLFKKEFQQNIIQYLLPAPFVLAWLYLHFTAAAALPGWTNTIFGLALPFTLAVAYGLQAFDVEEDAQTRDFLLVKPLSIGRIVGEKFLIGLVLLLFWTMLLLWGVTTGLFWPSTFAVKTWVPAFIILGTVLTYTVCFVTGLWVSGPKKLLAGILLSLIGLIWAFLSFSGFITFVLHNSLLTGMSFLQESAFYLLALIVTFAFITVHIYLSIWILLQRPRWEEIPRLMNSLLVFLLIPIIALTLNYLTHPLIRSTEFVGSELFGLEPAFWAIDGAWNPNGESVLLTGSGNLLGLGKPGQKPQIIYRGQRDASQSVADPIWSPNGNAVAFVDRGQVYLMNILWKKPVWIGKGFAPCWSSASDAVVFAQEIMKPQLVQTSNGRYLLHTFDFYRLDSKSGVVKPYLRVQALNTYWTWDSQTDSILFAEPDGQLSINRVGKIESLVLPAIIPKKELIFWSRFYPVPNAKSRYILVTFSFNLPKTTKGLESYTARFYRFDAAEKRITFLTSEARTGASNLIFNPADGTCWWGLGSTYAKDSIVQSKEETP